MDAQYEARWIEDGTMTCAGPYRTEIEAQRVVDLIDPDLEPRVTKTWRSDDWGTRIEAPRTQEQMVADEDAAARQREETP